MRSDGVNGRARCGVVLVDAPAYRSMFENSRRVAVDLVEGSKQV